MQETEITLIMTEQKNKQEQDLLEFDIAIAGGGRGMLNLIWFAIVEQSLVC